MQSFKRSIVLWANLARLGPFGMKYFHNHGSARCVVQSYLHRSRYQDSLKVRRAMYFRKNVAEKSRSYLVRSQLKVWYDSESPNLKVQFEKTDKHGWWINYKWKNSVTRILKYFRIRNHPSPIFIVRACVQLSPKLHFTLPSIMAHKSQRKHLGPIPAGYHYLTQSTTTTGGGRADATGYATAIEELVAPILSFPLTAAYPSELKASDFENTHSTIAKTTAQTTEQDQSHLNDEVQIQYSYVARPWDLQSHIQQGKLGGKNPNPFAVWACQDPVEEPFNNVGEVTLRSASRRQGKSHDGEHRRDKRQKRDGFWVLIWFNGGFKVSFGEWAWSISWIAEKNGQTRMKKVARLARNSTKGSETWL